MAVPESQLETWSHQGAITTSKATHESVRAALEHNDSPIAPRLRNGSVTVYLQGSYANDTNTRGDSDVDIIVELNTTFGHNAHLLPPEQHKLHQLSYDTADYDWRVFRNDVIAALNQYYDARFVDTSGNKSIKLLPTPGRLKADIVPVIVYRNYSHFHGTGDYYAVRGIKLYHRSTNEEIINYPRMHYDAGVNKHADRTNQWFKPTVRIFKNARSYLVDNGKLAKDAAPSYFLQNLIFNVPDELFGESYEKTVYNVLKYLSENPIAGFICQHGQHSLFGTSAQQWNEKDAKATIDALVALWNNWGK